ncbi:MAG: phosphate ABC transporter ATP-binding protein [Elusimicrobia bacterium RIFOXYC2_FULL_34_12]|nr:MAG: phosphate ABC transporter ATP-binding protein [Elusimicrobia bacterium RIFOXYC2_FULL_34_12]OGS39349.1 MAG: phosphate ABC transporter ATP-binding protein [Elusimicrobia bacterium RIFOXYD2_FULL_34_30]
MSIIKIENLNLFYTSFHALIDINAEFEENKITSIIGPSGCGKSTLLRTFNRMNDLTEGVRTNGKIVIDNDNILNPNYDLIDLRKKVGMVFQRPNPFPLSIFSNITFGLKIRGRMEKNELNSIVENSLKAVSLWNNLKDKLGKSALELTLEEQQRLCIARLIAVKPEIVLMDEPCSALDPIATERIEELMIELKENYTILIVTHNMQQAARISDFTGFMWLGELIEYNNTEKLFTNPKEKLTQDYITGRAG